MNSSGHLSNTMYVPVAVPDTGDPEMLGRQKHLIGAQHRAVGDGLWGKQDAVGTVGGMT